MMIAARNAFLMGGGGPTPWVNPYITDGLVAMWDGEWNAGGGVHDSAATTWKNLATDTRHLNVASNTSWTQNALSSTDTAQGGFANLSGTSNAFTASSVRTVFVIFSAQKTISQNASVLFSNGDATGAGKNIYFNKGGQYFIAKSRGANQLKRMAPLANYTNQTIASLVATFGSSNGSSVDGIWLNNTKYVNDTASESNRDPSNGLGIGVPGAGTYYKLAGAIYCCRVYSRVLTDAEIAAEYTVDAARFGL